MAVQPAADWVANAQGANGAVALGINFGPHAADTAGYTADAGAAYGDRGNGLSYGWDVVNTTRAADRGTGGTLDTLNSFAVGRSWELDVPNGKYALRVVSGDPARTGAPAVVRAEGEVVVAGRTSADGPWLDAT